jgi:glycerophosphoryl diester phosphodiesterase
MTGPLVIAHRGASGYRPEHTLAAYALAIRLGADYIEPDLVSTKDGILLARHENEISGTTDVASHIEFAGRRATKVVDGVALDGWFTEDFTLKELKTLRTKERIPGIRPRNTAYDGRCQVPTLQEVIDLARKASKGFRRIIGIYPETKHPTYFDGIGLSLEEPLVETLRRNRLAGRAAVFVQSFETTNLRELSEMIDVPLVQLIAGTGAPYDLVAAGDPRTYADLVTPESLKDIATYADGIGPDKNLIVGRTKEGRLAAPTCLIDNAHEQGLLVHAYTFRAENHFLPLDCRVGGDPRGHGRAVQECRLLYDLGVDGLFCDQPDTAVEARADFLGRSGRAA